MLKRILAAVLLMAACVQAQATTVSITAPATNTKSGRSSTITLSASASAADIGGTVSKVAFYHGLKLIGSDTTAPYTVNWASVPVGIYIIRARATDSSNRVTTSAPITVIVKLNVAPTVSITSPVSNANFNGPATITLAATAADSGLFGKVSKVSFYNGATLIGTDTKAPYSFNWTNVPAGTYTVTAHATDNANNVTTSAPITVNVLQSTAPTVSITAPLNHAIYVTPASIPLQASASVSKGKVSKVEFYRATTLIGTATTEPYAVTWSNVAAGSYSITAKATSDSGGVTTSPAISVTVINNAAPVVSLATSSTNAVAPAAITLTATASDSDGTIARVEFFNATTLLSTVTQPPYVFNWTAVPVGSYSVTAKATDNLGTATVSAPVAVTVAATTAAIYYIHSDQLNTPRLITDAANVPVWKWSSEPFGSTVPNENPSNKGAFTFNPRFAGQYFDRETNLHYNYYRDYDPLTGRYVESDPIGLVGGINTYGYVGGNPISFVDPSGLDRWGSYGYGRYVPSTNPSPSFWERLNFPETPEQRALGENIINGFVGGVCGTTKGVTAAANFFNGTNYSERVLGQMKTGDFHGFPRMVENNAASGSISTVIQPSTGLPKEMLTIPGSLRGVEGAFEFIKHESGVIYHRLFRPIE